MLSVLLIVRAVGRAVTVTRGQTLIEYTLILALIAIVTMLLMSAVGWDLQETFDGIENFLGAGSNGAPAAGDDDGVPS